MAIHYSYKNYGQLTNVQTDNGINASYAYDATGRRSAKTVNGTVTSQIWDGQNIVRETNASGAEIARYYRGSRLVAQKSGTAVSYYTYDAHGSVAAMNGQGYEYDAFGALLENGVTSHNPFRYNGEYYDEETGMIYLRARYYDSSIGRFITEDPIKDGLNWYAFCGNNPVTFVDPLGLFDYNTVLSYDPNHKNEDVLALQNELAYLGYLDVSDRDGYFGQKTLDAVNKYKEDAGLWNHDEYEGVVGLTTWQSLGLIYREQGDIDRGVTIFTEAEGRQLFDVTKAVNDALWYAGEEIKNRWFGDKEITFLKRVWHGSDWDIKREDGWKATLGITWPGDYNSSVIFKGDYSTPEELGNIWYGYTGSAVGFGEATLYEGSFLAAFPLNQAELQAEFNDWPAISKGIQWYKRSVK